MNVKFFGNWLNVKRETISGRKKECIKGAALLAAAALVFNMYSGGAAGVHAQEEPVLEPETEIVSPGEHTARIHFISLYGWTDAILLESDGHFGLIDGGEDWDYPTDMRYLTRSGITDYIGYEQQVIHYLQKAGVQKLDFMIGTHSHSDHIGSGDEIIEAIPTDRLYIQRYDDSYLRGYDGASKFDERYDYANMTGGLWDNQKNYDELIDAANERGTQIITDLDLEENKDSRTFSLGQMNIELMNCERDRDEAGEIVPVVDDNANSLGILVSAFDRYAFLAGDMMPTEKNSDMVRNANLLYEKLKDVPTQKYEENRSEPTADTAGGTSVSMLSIEDDTTVIKDTQDVGEETNDTGALEEKEEFEPTDKMENTTHRISIDLLKLPHHGSPYNNTPYFLTTLNPKSAVVTGFLGTLDDRMRRNLENTDMYATGTDSAYNGLII